MAYSIEEKFRLPAAAIPVCFAKVDLASKGLGNISVLFLQISRILCFL